MKKQKFMVWAVALFFSASLWASEDEKPKFDPETARRQVEAALGEMDPCVRELIERVVLKQGPFLAHQAFHQLHSVFEKLGLKFDRLEHEDIPLEVQDNLVSHRVLSVVRLYRGPIFTEFSTVETRVGAPRILAERVNARTFWHLDPRGGFVGVLEGEGAITRGVSELQRLWLEFGGSGPVLREEIAKIAAEGRRIFDQKANDAIEFYLRHVQRRSWSKETKARLVKEFFTYLDRSTLAVSRLGSEPRRVVGTLQMIRAPFGRRTVTSDSEGKQVIADEFGVWGGSVRKFGIRAVEIHHLDDWDVYERMDQNRLPNGALRLIQTPVEIKMAEQGIGIQRSCLPSSHETYDVEGKPVHVFWGEGEVDEPTRFAIDREFNPTLFVEVLLQLSISAVDPHFSETYNRFNRLLITYNDLPKLYLWANLRPSAFSLSIDDKKWPILIARGDEHIAALKKFNKILSAGDAEALSQIKSQVLGNY